MAGAVTRVPVPPGAVALELAVQDARGIEVAQRVGALRVEVCQALALGGLTPSVALIEEAAASSVEAHVLVRPRAGGFEYDEAERQLMFRDVRAAVERGAAGVVVGGLAGDRLDAQLMQGVIDAADGHAVTFHRAFDLIADHEEAIDELVALGVVRVLSSGRASRAGDGVTALRNAVRFADDRVEIMAGGGVTVEAIPALVDAGVAAIHASAKRTVSDRLPISLGSGQNAGRAEYETADEATASRFAEAIRSTCTS